MKLCHLAHLVLLASSTWALSDTEGELPHHRSLRRKKTHTSHHTSLKTGEDYTLTGTYLKSSDQLNLTYFAMQLFIQTTYTPVSTNSTIMVRLLYWKDTH